MRPTRMTNGQPKSAQTTRSVLEKLRDRDFAKNPTLLKMTNISDWGQKTADKSLYDKVR